MNFFLLSRTDFLFIFGQCGGNCKYSVFLERKVGVTDHLRAYAIELSRYDGAGLESKNTR